MKFALIAVLFATVIAFSEASSKLRWSTVHIARSLCEMRVHANDGLIKIARDHDFSWNDETTQSYVLCVYRRLRLLNSDGTLDPSAGEFIPRVDPEKYSKAVGACNGVEGSDAKDKLWQTLSCFYHKYPDCVSVI